MTTGFYTHAACVQHDMGQGHPESPLRLGAITDHLRASGLDAMLAQQQAPLAKFDDLARAHERDYVLNLLELMHRMQNEGDTRAVDPDTWVCPHTLQAALHAAGAAVAATDAVIDGSLDNAFCAVRPPGHHASRSQAMGFCFFNNVAIAARHALEVRGLSRVAVVDFDVHHGNGTEDILAGDDRTLMVSFFQHPFYPYCGGPSKARNMVNVPVPAHTRGAEVRDLVREQWAPALERFRPEMIFVSAGFDAHREDEMGQMELTEADYAWLTERIVEVAERHAKGRVVSVLEGGYSLSALGRSVVAHVRAMAGA